MFRVILMCLLTCCSSFMPLKQSESNISEDHTQVVEKKTRENYVRTASGFYEYGVTDMLSYDFARSVIVYYVYTLGATELDYARGETGQYVVQTSGVYSVFFFQGNETYSKAFDVYNVVLSKYNWGNTSFRYEFTFSNASPYDKQITFEWTCQKNNDQQLIIMGGNMFPTGLSSFGDDNGWRARFMLSEDGSSRSAFIYDLANKVHSDDYNSGYNQGYNDGFTIGYDSGETNGYEDGYTAGESAGYQTGFQAGVDDTIASGTEAMTIFSGIMDVAFIPVNVFFLMFNYEVFGINIAGFVSGLLTIAIVLIIFKFILGRKV